MDIGCSCIQDMGTKALAKSLTQNLTLFSLNLFTILNSDHTNAAIMLQALLFNRTITTLTLGPRKWSEDTLRQIEQCVQRNQRLKGMSMPPFLIDEVVQRNGRLSYPRLDFTSYIPSPNDFSGFSTDRPEQFGFRRGGEE